MKTRLLFFVLFSTLTIYSQTQIGVDINGEAAGDNSGASVCLSSDGTIMAIGATGYEVGNGAGQVRIYQNNAGVWTQIGTDIDGEAIYDSFGTSVSLSSDGSIIAIGAPFNDGNGSNSGHVRIYQNISDVWTQIGLDIIGEAAGDSSGGSVSLSSDGTIVAIGANQNDGNGSNSGHVRVYKNISGVWTQLGDDINGEAAGDASGFSVSLSSDGTIVAIGAPKNDANGNDSGHVRVYKNNSGDPNTGVWIKVWADIEGEYTGDWSGHKVSLSSDGSIVAIGAYKNAGNGYESGHVRVYQDLDVWTQIGTDIDGEAASDNSGNSISLSSDGNLVTIGAFQNDGNGTSSGHTRIYQNLLGIWTQIGTDIDGEAMYDASGFSVSISSDGSTVASGAISNSANGVSSGHVRVYDLTSLTSNYQTTDVVTGLIEPIGLVLNGNDLFISEYNGLKISKIDITAATPTTASDVATGLSGPWYILRNGNDLYIADYWGDKVSKIDITAATPTITDVITLGGPAGLALHGNDLYISEYDDTKISKIDITATNPTATDVVTGLDGPTGLLLNGNDLYIADYYGDKLSKIDITDANPTITNVLTSLSKPEGLALHGNDLYISEYTGNKIIKINITEATPTVEYVVTGLDGPTGMLFIDDVLYIAERDGNKISKTNTTILGIKDHNLAINSLFYMYPNPANDILTISLKYEFMLQNIGLYNTLGQQVLISEKTVIDVSSLAKGIYFVVVSTDQGKEVKKVIIE